MKLQLYHRDKYKPSKFQNYNRGFVLIDLMWWSIQVVNITMLRFCRPQIEVEKKEKIIMGKKVKHCGLEQKSTIHLVRLAKILENLAFFACICCQDLSRDWQISRKKIGSASKIPSKLC